MQKTAGEIAQLLGGTVIGNKSEIVTSLNSFELAKKGDLTFAGDKRYLEKLGEIAPMNSALKSVFEAGFNSDRSYHSLVVALNIVMEGEALNQQHKRIETLPCPLFAQINKAIVRDESRHAAFGKIYMREKVKELSRDEKSEIFEWIKTLWFLWNKANQGRYTIEGSEILQTKSDELDDRWQYQMKIFQELQFCDSQAA